MLRIFTLTLGSACGLTASFLVTASFSAAANQKDSLVFDPAVFTVKSAVVGDKTIRYRAYEGIVYVRFPVDAQTQRMNIYVPVEYYEGKPIGSYRADTAPIFFPNSVGGYMPGPAGNPGAGFDGKPNAALVALSKGFVVAAPGVRGRTSTNATGQYTGKAPAAIVDLKAAVRYLRANDKLIPGTAEKIISNGTSAGGALSALLGASGNNPDYEPYLKALGAAEARDDIFSVSTYCPITNLENADTAYEWLFGGIHTYARGGIPGPGPGPGMPPARGPGMPPGGPMEGVPPGAPDLVRAFSGKAPPPAVQARLSADQIKLSDALKARFPDYVNSLKLRSPTGKPLTLDRKGNGAFKDYLKSLVVASAQRALQAGTDLRGLAWIEIKEGRVTDLDVDGFVRFIGRLKGVPAFDSLELGSPENGLFGDARVDARHFTRFAKEHGSAGAGLADDSIVGLMNPMRYIGGKDTTSARHWRIRHGAADRDTSLAIPALLASQLAQGGMDVDFFSPWAQGHGGDYDLDQLFAWAERVCASPDDR